jgi:hypothetical protein
MGKERGEERDNGGGGKEWLTIRSPLSLYLQGKESGEGTFFGFLAW